MYQVRLRICGEIYSHGQFAFNDGLAIGIGSGSIPVLANREWLQTIF